MLTARDGVPSLESAEIAELKHAEMKRETGNDAGWNPAARWL